MKNLFEIIQLPKSDSELFETLVKAKNIEIKKIVSNTLTTPRTFVQEEDEFVVLLKGCAKIEINSEVKKLKAGDWLFIPGGTEHTLLKTKKTAVWLAVQLIGIYFFEVIKLSCHIQHKHIRNDTCRHCLHNNTSPDCHNRIMSSF